MPKRFDVDRLILMLEAMSISKSKDARMILDLIYTGFFDLE